MTDLSLRAPQAFTEDQLLLVQPGVSILQVTVSFTVDAHVPLWFCVIQGAFWASHERQQERESVQSSVQRWMQPCAIAHSSEEINITEPAETRGVE